MPWGLWLLATLSPSTHLSLSLSLLVLQGEEVQVCHLQLHLAGFQEAADVPVDTGAGGGLDNACRERRAVSEFFRGCSQCPPLTITEKRQGYGQSLHLTKKGALTSPSSYPLLRIWQSLGEMDCRSETHSWLLHLVRRSQVWVITSLVGFLVSGVTWAVV